jgi:hypothetical protein
MFLMVVIVVQMHDALLIIVIWPTGPGQLNVAHPS